MLKRLTFKAAKRKTGGLAFLCDEDMQFEAAYDENPWARQGDIVCAHPVADGGIEPGQLVVVRRGRRYALEVCPSLRCWDALERVVGIVDSSVRVFNLAGDIERRLAAIKCMESAGQGRGT